MLENTLVKSQGDPGGKDRLWLGIMEGFQEEEAFKLSQSLEWEFDRLWVVNWRPRGRKTMWCVGLAILSFVRLRRYVFRLEWSRGCGKDRLEPNWSMFCRKVKWSDPGFRRAPCGLPGSWIEGCWDARGRLRAVSGSDPKRDDEACGESSCLYSEDTTDEPPRPGWAWRSWRDSWRWDWQGTSSRASLRRSRRGQNVEGEDSPRNSRWGWGV